MQNSEVNLLLSQLVDMLKVSERAMPEEKNEISPINSLINEKLDNSQQQKQQVLKFEEELQNDTPTQQRCWTHEEQMIFLDYLSAYGFQHNTKNFQILEQNIKLRSQKQIQTHIQTLINKLNLLYNKLQQQIDKSIHLDQKQSQCLQNMVFKHFNTTNGNFNITMQHDSTITKLYHFDQKTNILHVNFKNLQHNLKTVTCNQLRYQFQQIFMASKYEIQHRYDIMVNFLCYKYKVGALVILIKLLLD